MSMNIDKTHPVNSAWKVIPTMHCSSIKKALDFYLGTLHFNLGGAHPSDENDYADATMASIAVGKKCEANIYLYQKPASELHVSEVMIALGTDELDQYYDMLVKAGKVEITEPIEDKPWGYRQFELLDPDGNRVQFFKFIEGGNPGKGDD